MLFQLGNDAKRTRSAIMKRNTASHRQIFLMYTLYLKEMYFFLREDVMEKKTSGQDERIVHSPSSLIFLDCYKSTPTRVQPR